MNRTQKGAWFTLGISSLLVIFLALVFRTMFVAGDRRAGVGLVRFWLWLILLFLIVALFFVWRKQSPAEPAADERDHVIKRNAVLASFVSVWILLALETILPPAFVGDTGALPVFLLPIINTALLIIAMLVYSATVLLQYGRQSKGERE